MLIKFKRFIEHCSFTIYNKYSVVFSASCRLTAPQTLSSSYRYVYDKIVLAFIFSS